MQPLSSVKPLERTHAQAAQAVSTPPRVTPGRKLVGLLGGSFDPMTPGHRGRIEELVTSYRQDVLGPDGAPAKRRIDALWLIPVFQHYFPEKREEMAPYQDRLNMMQVCLGKVLGAATADKAELRISNIEQQLGGISRTYDTIAALKTRNPNVDFVLYLGSDIRNEVDKWYRFGDIQTLAGVQFLARGGYDNDGTAGTASLTISSTDVRRAIAKEDWDEVARICDPGVAAYLKQHPDIVKRYTKRESK
jgi:nicotinate-nucleotide adenylyltransferase